MAKTKAIHSFLHPLLKVVIKAGTELTADQVKGAPVGLITTEVKAKKKADD